MSQNDQNRDQVSQPEGEGSQNLKPEPLTTQTSAPRESESSDEEDMDESDDDRDADSRDGGPNRRFNIG